MTPPTRLNLFLSIACALVFVGCAPLGANPTPPTAFEKDLYNVQTNQVPLVAWHTNEVTLTNTVTVTKTNEAGAPITVTNTVVVTKEVPVLVTNTVPAYTLTPNDTVKSIAQAAGSIGNAVLPGAGDAIALGLLALVGFWGHLRSYKASKTVATQTATSAALAQEIETVREFIKTLPSGTKYDQVITGFLQDNQVSVGVAQQVLDLLRTEVSNPEAKVAAGELQNIIAAITKPTP